MIDPSSSEEDSEEEHGHHAPHHGGGHHGGGGGHHGHGGGAGESTQGGHVQSSHHHHHHGHSADQTGSGSGGAPSGPGSLEVPNSGVGGMSRSLSPSSGVSVDTLGSHSMGSSRANSLPRPTSPSPSVASEKTEVELQEKQEREEEERKRRIQLYVFISRCIAYPFNAKQPTDMTRRQTKITKHQLETITARFQVGDSRTLFSVLSSCSTTV